MMKNQNQLYLLQPDLSRIPTTPSQSVSMVEIAEEDENEHKYYLAVLCSMSFGCKATQAPTIGSYYAFFELYHHHSKKNEHDQEDNRQNHHQVGDHGEEMQIPTYGVYQGGLINNQSFNLRLPKQNQQTGPELSILLRNAKKQKQKHPAILSSSAHAGSTNTGQFSDEDFMDDGQVEAFHAYRAAGK